MSTALFFNQTARKDLEKTRQDYGPGLAVEFREWLGDVAESALAGTIIESALEVTRFLRPSEPWWSGIHLSTREKLQGLFYTLYHRQAPYEFWISERRFALGDSLDVAPSVILNVDRVNKRVVILKIDDRTSGSARPIPATGPSPVDDPRGPAGVGGETWESSAERRIRLIDKEYDGELTSSEAEELRRLQRLSLEAVDRSFPVPGLSREDLASVRRALGENGEGGR